MISKRDFLRSMGIGVAGLATGKVVGDEPVASKSGLPAGSIGDPKNPSFGRNIFPLDPTMTDGPSCRIVDGEVFEPAHRLPVFHETDVVVVGGGTAGFAAAIAAKRAGAKVALVERYGSLGGLFTNGMVLIMLSACRREAGGDWTLVTRGICGEFMHRAYALGADVSTFEPAKTGNKKHMQPTVDPEGAKYLMDTMIQEAGVEMFFHSWGVDVIQDGNTVMGIVFESKQGRQAILAKQIVDCSGDADMLFRAGGDYRQITHGIGHDVLLANMDRVKGTKTPEGRLRKWPTRSNTANKSMWWGSVRIPPVDRPANGLDIRELSRAEVEFRKYWWEEVREMRKTPGWEEVYIAATASQIGPRATRLVDTEVVVDRKMIAEGKLGDETIGWFGHDGAHAAWAVPYRAIVPKKVENLLCAGRCLGAGDTIDTFRLICPCFVTGQAAGVAAALSARKGTSPRSLAYSDLRSELHRQEVFL